MSDRRDRGAGQKSEGSPTPAPLFVSRTDFFVGDQNFDLFGHPVDAQGKAIGAAEPRRPQKTAAMAKAVQRLAEAGLTRRQIAGELGVGESTLYQNYFREIGGRRGQPGRRLHEPSDAQRQIVRDMRARGAAHHAIAVKLGVSQPTLRRAYANELSHAKLKGSSHDD